MSDCPGRPGHDPATTSRRPPEGELPVSAACERNREPILEVLREVFTAPGDILEIGSGTGQHAVHFSSHLPHLTWHACDLADYHPGIRAWMDHAGPANLKGPYLLDVTVEPWPLSQADGVFSANTAHIMHMPAVAAMFAGVGRRLAEGGHFCLYGPFSVNGEHRSDSNRRFDRQLRDRDPGMGIRDRSELEALAAEHGLVLAEVHHLPANNDLLVWQRVDS